jgi:hypothetical protein
MSDNFPTLSKVHELLRYEPETGKLFWKVSTSNRVKVGSEAGTIAKIGYRYVKIDGHRLLAHRLIFFIKNGEWPKQDIDHMDGDRLNNSWDNLRECSRQINNENKRNASRNSFTGVLGVSPSRGKFHAQIQTAGKNKSLGRFKTIEEAKSVYLTAKAKLHKGFVG